VRACACVCACVRVRACACVIELVKTPFQWLHNGLSCDREHHTLFPQKSHEENDVLRIVPPDGHGHYKAVRRLLRFGQNCSVMLVQYNQTSCLLKTYNFHGLIGEIMLVYEVAKKYVFFSRQCSIVFCW